MSTVRQVVESTGSKISFRIQASYAEQVHRWSEALNMGPNQLARLALVQFLENAGPHDTREQVLTLRAEIGCLKDSMRRFHELIEQLYLEEGSGPDEDQ